MGLNIAVLGSVSSHGGSIIGGTALTTFAEGLPVALEGCQHSCPIPFHGVTSVTPITFISFAEGRRIVTVGAVAGCGAVIIGGIPTMFAD